MKIGKYKLMLKNFEIEKYEQFNEARLIANDPDLEVKKISKKLENNKIYYTGACAPRLFYNVSPQAASCRLLPMFGPLRVKQGGRVMRKEKKIKLSSFTELTWSETVQKDQGFDPVVAFDNFRLNKSRPRDFVGTRFYKQRRMNRFDIML